MENMDLDQTAIQNVEGATSYLSKKAVIEWSHLLDFGRYDNDTNSQAAEAVISECEKKIEARKKLYEEALESFKNITELKEKQPCSMTSTVKQCFREIQEVTNESLQEAYELWPKFTDYVNKYVEYKNGPLARFQLTQGQYFKKLEQLAKIPNAEELIKELNIDKDYKKVEHHSGLAQSDIDGINHFLQVNKDIFIWYKKENVVNAEQFGEMKDLLIQLEALMKDLPSVQSDYETAQISVYKYVMKYRGGLVDIVCQMECVFESVDFTLNIMHEQLDLLIKKDVKNKGYDKDFEEEWLTNFGGGGSGG